MTLPTKYWRPEFGPVPAALAGKIAIDPTPDEVRAAATRFYIDEVAAIEAEPDPDVARERARRLDETLNDALPRARLARLSPAAGRLMRAMEQASTKGGDHDLDASGLPIATPVGKLLQLRPGQDVAVFGDVPWDGRRA